MNVNILETRVFADVTKFRPGLGWGLYPITEVFTKTQREEDPVTSEAATG